jgi:hypothetical protein
MAQGLRLDSGMVKKKTPPKESTSAEVSELVDASKDVRQEAMARAHECALAVQEVLAKFNCRIMPRIDVADIEPVGHGGNKIQIESTYWIAPLAS